MKRCFGIEIETSKNKSQEDLILAIKSVSTRPVRGGSWRESIGNNDWQLKEDSSCGPSGHRGRDNGWEISSYKSQMEDLEDIIASIEKVADTGCFTTPNCGLHIHAEILDFEPANAGNLYAWWLKFENLISFMMPNRRLKNKHCKLLRNYLSIPSSISSPEALWDQFKPTDYGIHGNSQKKVTLNFVNYARSLNSESYGEKASARKTVELRWPESTLNTLEIKAWIRFYLRFVEQAKHIAFPEDLSPIDTIAGLENYLEIDEKDELLLRLILFQKIKLYSFERKNKKLHKESLHKLSELLDK